MSPKADVKRLLEHRSKEALDYWGNPGREPGEPCRHCNGTGTTQDWEAIGHQFRRFRETTGLSLREIARRADVSPGFVHDIETGKRNPYSTVRSRRVLAEISKAFVSTPRHETRPR